jgi:transposase-like protein
MVLSRRKFTKEFKLAAVRRLEMGASVAEVARACEVNPNLLHRWRQEFRDGVERAFPGLGKKRASEENHIAELEQKIGQQTLEIDFLKRVLQRVEEARRLQALHRTAPSTNRSTKKSNGKRP